MRSLSGLVGLKNNFLNVAGMGVDDEGLIRNIAPVCRESLVTRTVAGTRKSESLADVSVGAAFELGLLPDCPFHHPPGNDPQLM